VHLLLTLSLALPAGALALVITRLYGKGDSHEHAEVMTVVMAAAMSAGLMAGLIAGLLSPADLWPPTITGVVTGLVLSLARWAPWGHGARTPGYAAVSPGRSGNPGCRRRGLGCGEPASTPSGPSARCGRLRGNPGA